MSGVSDLYTACGWLHGVEAVSLRMNWAFLPRQPIRVGRSCVVLPD